MDRYLNRLMNWYDLLRTLVHGGFRVFRHLQLHGVKQTAYKIARSMRQQSSYANWILKHEPASRLFDELKSNCAGWQVKPFISVLMPTFNSNLIYLDQAINSLRNQVYPYWQLCIADDASNDPEVLRYLKKISSEDERIIVSFRDANGHISAASNTALMTATGDWVALLDHDDLLHPLALYRVAEVLQSRPDAHLIYSDEDKITTHGRRYAPYFKGEYNRELMWAQNVISHLGCYRRRLVVDVGGFQLGYEGSQDYDLALRVIEHSHPSQIIHIPHVLYHWRALPGSTALASSEKDYASPASRRALQAHLSRIGILASVGPAPRAPTMNRVKIELPSAIPLVSIIISNQDRPDLLEQCIRAIQKHTDDKNIEIIPLERHACANISAQQNIAAQSASGEYLCMMSSHIEPTSAGWLEEMLSFAQLQDVGAVGARLVSPGKDSRLRHIGLVAGLCGAVGYAHAGLDAKHTGYFGRAVLHQRLTAVTQRCLVIRKDRFISVGGFDESLCGDFSDLDLCLRLSRAGYHSVFTPHAELLFHEVPANPNTTNRRDVERAQDLINTRWMDELANDRYYSPNLSLDHSDFRISNFSRPPS